jgi:hypothetical protein
MHISFPLCRHVRVVLYLCLLGLSLTATSSNASTIVTYFDDLTVGTTYPNDSVFQSAGITFQVFGTLPGSTSTSVVVEQFIIGSTSVRSLGFRGRAGVRITMPPDAFLATARLTSQDQSFNGLSVNGVSDGVVGGPVSRYNGVTLGGALLSVSGPPRPRNVLPIIELSAAGAIRELQLFGSEYALYSLSVEIPEPVSMHQTAVAVLCLLTRPTRS